MTDVWIGTHCPACGQLVGGIPETSVSVGSEGKVIKKFLRCDCGFRPYVTEEYNVEVTVEHVEGNRWTPLD